jgi:hypothetical protein
MSEEEFVVFLVAVLCSVVDEPQCFEGPCCLLLQGSHHVRRGHDMTSSYTKIQNFLTG